MTNSSMASRLPWLETTIHDAVTVELDPHRQSSVAISELRERLMVANEALDLSLQIVLDPI